MDEELPGAGEPIGDDPPWEPWSPAELARRLAGTPVTWYVAGGWSIDLFLRRWTRPHEDLEIAVPTGEFGAVRSALAGFDIEAVADGRRWPATPTVLGRTYQTWVREPGGGPYRLDIFREPHEGDLWICRRDPRIRLPYRQVIGHTADGIPFLAPHISLLFKAKWSGQAKNEHDFAAVLPLLSPARREWLLTALHRVHPGHPWIARIIAGPGLPAARR